MKLKSRVGGLALLIIAALLGCAPSYVKGTDIEYSPERQALADIVESYRKALEERDQQTLMRLADDKYYENGSTTSEPSDDFDYKGLKRVTSDLHELVKAVKYQIKITSIDLYDERATVDFEYEGQYLFSAGEQDKWATAADKNRLTFRKKGKEWLIISGM